jgi:hypothetical protein
MRFRLHHLIIVLALLLLAACNKGNSANTNSTTAFDEGRVKIGDGRVSFVPPSTLKQLTKDQIAASRFSKDKSPDYLFANDSQSVTIGVVFNFIELAPDQLEEYKDASHRLLTMAIEDVQFLADEMVTINGRQWVHFEVKSDAPDVDLHNHQYSTSFDGGALVFGFNSTAKEYPQFKDAFWKSAQSIVVK